MSRNHAYSNLDSSHEAPVVLAHRAAAAAAAVGGRVVNDTIAEMKVEPHERGNPMIRFIVAEYNSWNRAIAKTFFPRPHLNPNSQREYHETMMQQNDYSADGLIFHDPRSNKRADQSRDASNTGEAAERSVKRVAMGDQYGLQKNDAIAYVDASSSAASAAVRNASASARHINSNNGQSTTFVFSSSSSPSSAYTNSVVTTIDIPTTTTVTSTTFIGYVKCKHISECTTNAISRTKGLCKNHGGQTRCKHESDCVKSAVENGLCWSHSGHTR